MEGNEKQKNEIKIIFFILVHYTDFWCFFILPMIIQIIWTNYTSLTPDNIYVA